MTATDVVIEAATLGFGRVARLFDGAVDLFRTIRSANRAGVDEFVAEGSEVARRADDIKSEVFSDYADLQNIDYAELVRIQDDFGAEALAKLNAIAKNVEDLVDLTAHRKAHILNGHKSGAGKSGKTEFPASWSDDQLLHYVSDVATDPNAVRGVGRFDGPYAIAFRDGIEIRVDFYPSNSKYAGQISTAYPINVPANP